MKTKTKNLIIQLEYYQDQYSRALRTILKNYLQNSDYEQMINQYVSITPGDGVKFHNRWSLNIRLAILEIMYPK